MDNLTHSLVGALLGQAGLKKKTGLAMPALIIAANLPDVDAACFFWLEGQEHLGFRRGITHGPPALVLLPLILAGLLWGFDRWQTKRGKRPADRLPVNFKWLFALSFIGCLTHPALDWLNVYGIRFLEPFSSQWFYGDTLFIIDIWLWLLMGFATWFSLRREKRGQNWMKPARIAIAVSLAYIGTNWVGTTYRELTSSHQPAIASPMPLIPWEREVIEAQSHGTWLIDGVKVGECELDPAFAGAFGNSEAEAFLLWARAPFAERARDGSVILRDARFYGPAARDRFSIALPNVECMELSGQ